jgi:hypothetical protein
MYVYNKGWGPVVSGISSITLSNVQNITLEPIC